MILSGTGNEIELIFMVMLPVLQVLYKI